MDLQPPSNLPLGPTEPVSPGAMPPVPPPVPPVAPPIAPPIQSMPSSSPVADDMFSGVDRTPAASPVQSQPTSFAPASAAPNTVPPVTPAPARVLPSLPESTHPPVLHYVLIALAVVVVLGVIAGAVWFFAIRRPTRQVMETLPAVPEMTSSTSDAAAMPDSSAPIDEPLDSGFAAGEPELIPPKPVVTPPDGANVPPPTSIDPNAVPPLMTTPDDQGLNAISTSTATGSSQSSTSTDILVEPTTPPTADQDGDSLSDAREAELGTNYAVVDTDGDGLNDGDEVVKYRTNPLVPDTDGDTFPDGVEVQKGYNPLGPGKCANPACTF